MIDFDKILFHPSQLGRLMTLGDNVITDIQLARIEELLLKKAQKSLTPNQDEELVKLRNKRDNPVISDTTLKMLVEIYAESQGRVEEISSKYMEKGTTVENEAITIYCLVKKQFYKKNMGLLRNQYLEGTPDLYTGEILETATEVIDIKSSWSLITFLMAKYNDKMKKEYKLQGNGYLALVGPQAETFRLAYCLVNTPAKLILDEKAKLKWRMNIIDPDGPDGLEYLAACKQIEINHIFDIARFRKDYPHYEFSINLEEEGWQWDIPKEQRVYELTTMRDNELIGKIYDRAIYCREWMKQSFIQI